MKYLITAVIRGQKLEIVIACEDESHAERLKDQICRLLYDSTDSTYMTEMRVET